MRDRRTRLLFQEWLRERTYGVAGRRSVPPRPVSMDRSTTRVLRQRQFSVDRNAHAKYHREAPGLAAKAVNRLIAEEANEKITHLIVTSCTGFAAPGVDFEIFDFETRIFGRTDVIGFMGCNAAINALKLARHIVRSTPDSRVLIVSVELCTLHLQELDRVEQLLSFLLFGDGCAAAIVSGEPHGLSSTLSTPSSRKTRQTRSLGTLAILASTWSSRPGSLDDAGCSKGVRNASSPACERRVSDVGDSSWRSQRTRRR